VWFEELKIDGTKIRQHPLGPHVTPVDLDSVRDCLYGSLPKIHLPEVLLDIDAQIRFRWILFGREPASEEELLHIYVALLGHVMDLSAPRMQLMMPRLYVHTLAGHGIGYDQPLAVTQRQQGAAIEGALRHDAREIRGDRLASAA
jgi:hypothetical protein